MAILTTSDGYTYYFLRLYLLARLLGHDRGIVRVDDIVRDARRVARLGVE